MEGDDGRCYGGFSPSSPWLCRSSWFNDGRREKNHFSGRLTDVVNRICVAKFFCKLVVRKKERKGRERRGYEEMKINNIK